ncbi:NAD(P)H-dependent oxidoreductase [Paenibacillus sp. MMS18-CY102]|uniref:NAD(P)H-dependent oxidoreductase n=1 Tax=Paenibacillus sp. MMS18-CY102 TaxID=2682849 RepID=UPI001365B8E6|nr:NAD(P)H-dependent oxidoreductase [Paenibacillus sp. MMS18-CY102]MWC30238.1 general stress protein [Paenibacillus sp. MMS18-CY102]
MKTMVICAHPNLNESRANRAFAAELHEEKDLYFRDLYREYPDWAINVEREQQLLLAYGRIVFQFPFYWYSSPPLLKKWFDDVLTFGWAFGPGGEHLRGKEFILATTTGGTENSYRSGGDNLYTASELLRPIEQTINRCNGSFLPAFIAYNVSTATDGQLAQEAKRYADHIRATAQVLAH